MIYQDIIKRANSKKLILKPHLLYTISDMQIDAELIIIFGFYHPQKSTVALPEFTFPPARQKKASVYEKKMLFLSYNK